MVIVKTVTIESIWIYNWRLIMETLKINGMSCGHCTGSVQKALEAIPGLSHISVDLEGKKASFKNDGVAREEIRAAISNIGFEPEE